MPRIQFSDVTPPEKRSIRDVPIPSGGKRKVPIVIKPEKTPVSKTEPIIPETPPLSSSQNFNSKMAEMTEKKKDGPYEYYYPKNKTSLEEYRDLPKNPNKSRKKPIIFGVVIVILVVIFVISMMTIFSSATIAIIPKSQDLEVDMKITATNEVIDGVVAYEILKLSKTKTISAPATGEEAVERKASGKIVIYNNYSFESQRLITRTRFETAEGLIYRVPESVIVPGKSVKNGTETPGSIEVEVFADEAGEKYNIKKTDFTIPGFKNDAGRYKNFYARSSTEMVGGFVGKMKTISASEKQAILQNISSEAEMELEKDLQLKTPNELVLLPNSIIYKSKELPQKEEGSSVILGKEVTAYALMLNRKNLSDQISSEYMIEISTWNNIKPEIKDFSLLGMVSKPDNIETGGKMELQIKGKAIVLASIDANIIGQKLLGAPKNNVANLIDEFDGISSITATIRPIWKQSFPTNPSKIHVQIDQVK